MRPIERAARAFIEECNRQNQEGPEGVYAYHYGDLTDVTIDGKVDMLALMRAVLLALREPSEGMVIAGMDELDDAHRVRAIWQAQIDAALEEKP